MRHYEKEAWLQYVQSVLSEEAAAEMEQHLYTCDLCLMRFASCVGEMSSSLPLPSENLPERLIAAAIPAPASAPASAGAPSAATGRRVISDRMRTLRNYGIAAAATIALVATGVFNGLLKQVDAWQQQNAARESSVSAALVEHAANYFDQLHPNK